MFNSWLQAILHIDGDSFFASCLQSIDPSLRGKPIVVGRDRGIATAVSPEAKKLGITRGMPIYQIKKFFPECIIGDSDYELYESISHKMFEIIRKYTPAVEVYSIDEAFADISGFRAVYRRSYEEIALMIKNDIQQSLGLTVSAGLSVNKSLAKLASNHQKPDGFFAISASNIDSVLSQIPIGAVWGIGPNTSALLQKYDVKTALDFAHKPEQFVRAVLAKPGIEIWKELNGAYVIQLNPKPKETYQTLSTIRTFTPLTQNRDFLYGQLISNLEKVCAKARRYKLVAKKMGCYLKDRDFKMTGMEVVLTTASAYQTDMAPHIRRGFECLFQKGKFYRATMIVLFDLRSDVVLQQSLFQNAKQAEKIKLVFDVVDRINTKSGVNMIKTASTLFNVTKENKRQFAHPLFFLNV